MALAPSYRGRGCGEPQKHSKAGQQLLAWPRHGNSSQLRACNRDGKDVLGAGCHGTVGGISELISHVVLPDS